MDTLDRGSIANDDEAPWLAVPAAPGPASDLGQRLEFRVGRRLGRELADLPRTQQRPDALEGRFVAHEGSGAWRDSISVDGALWTAGIVPSRPAW